MLRTDSVSARMAAITRQVDARGGRVTVEELERIFAGFGITRQKAFFKRTLVNTGYLHYDPVEMAYRLTAESTAKAKITIEITPSLFAEEVRRELVNEFARFEGVIAVGEVEL